MSSGASTSRWLGPGHSSHLLPEPRSTARLRPVNAPFVFKSFPRLILVVENNFVCSRQYGHLEGEFRPLQTSGAVDQTSPAATDLHKSPPTPTYTPPRPSPTSIALRTATDLRTPLPTSVRFRRLPYGPADRYRPCRPPQTSVRFRGPKGRAIKGNRF
ncbi:hypothetical protein F4803DRAFT_557998 [Xylaria telfairii]|nr:hypothetical protein F4803DRAFT_557998 [Xylaria telfairii]